MQFNKYLKLMPCFIRVIKSFLKHPINFINIYIQLTVTREDCPSA